MPLPKWPDPVRDNNNSSSSMNFHNNSSSTSLSFQPGGDLRSPQKRVESKKYTPQRSFKRGPPAPVVKPLDREDCGRMFHEFSDKAEVTFLPEEDHLAASVYGDAKLHPERKQTVTKERTSGYDFNEMLKNQDINLSWGNASSSRW
jgi:hypothetical protein